jgi:hypothetical protein
MKKKTRRSLLKREKRGLLQSQSFMTCLSQATNTGLSLTECNASETTPSFNNMTNHRIRSINNGFEESERLNTWINQDLFLLSSSLNTSTSATGLSSIGLNNSNQQTIPTLSSDSYKMPVRMENYTKKYSDSKRFSITTSFIPIDDYSESKLSSYPSVHDNDQYNAGCKMPLTMTSTASATTEIPQSFSADVSYSDNQWMSTVLTSYPDQSSFNLDHELEMLRKKCLGDVEFSPGNDDIDFLLFGGDKRRPPRRQSIVVSPSFTLS